MRTHEHSDTGDSLLPAREGRYDAQMMIPAPELGFAGPLTTIIKRDGREVPFDKGKIARAIQVPPRPRARKISSVPTAWRPGWRFTCQSN